MNKREKNDSNRVNEAQEAKAHRREIGPGKRTVSSSIDDAGSGLTEDASAGRPAIMRKTIATVPATSAYRSVIRSAFAPYEQQSSTQESNAPIMRKAEGTAKQSDSALENASNSGSGAPLPGPLRSSLETSLSADLGAVRVHTDQPAAKAATSLGASAFAQGTDVYFGSGNYRPESTEGKRLIAHEVAHTVQSTGALQLKGASVSSPTDRLEREADAFADSFVSSEESGGASTVTSVQKGGGGATVFVNSGPMVNVSKVLAANRPRRTPLSAITCAPIRLTLIGFEPSCASR